MRKYLALMIIGNELAEAVLPKDRRTLAKSNKSKMGGIKLC